MLLEGQLGPEPLVEWVHPDPRQQQPEDGVAGVSGSVVEGLPELLGEGGWQGRKPGDGASSLG